MAHPRQMALAAVWLVATACGRGGPTPPSGEVRSALAVPTVTGDAFDPDSLSADVTLVTFWAPS